MQNKQRQRSQDIAWQAGALVRHINTLAYIIDGTERGVDMLSVATPERESAEAHGWAVSFIGAQEQCHGDRPMATLESEGSISNSELINRVVCAID